MLCELWVNNAKHAEVLPTNVSFAVGSKYRNDGIAQYARCMKKILGASNFHFKLFVLTFSVQNWISNKIKCPKILLSNQQHYQKRDTESTSHVQCTLTGLNDIRC